MSNSEKILKTISTLIETGILTSKDIRKELIEGQTLESYDYQEFQPILNDDIVDEQLKEHLNKYSKDIDNILKKTIEDKNVEVS